MSATEVPFKHFKVRAGYIRDLIPWHDEGSAWHNVELR